MHKGELANINPPRITTEPCGENVGKIQAKEKAKYWIIKYLAFFLVPRPGVEPGWK